jgi:hypothetical protein
MVVEAWTNEPRLEDGPCTAKQLVMSTSKCTCGDDVDNIDQVKTGVEQVKASA